MTIICNDERSGVLDLSIKITVKLYISKKETMKHRRQIKDVLIIFFSIYMYNFFTHVLVFSEEGWSQRGYSPPLHTHTLVFTQIFIKYTDMELNLNSQWGKGSYIIPVHCSFLYLQFSPIWKSYFFKKFSCQDFLNEWLSSSKTKLRACSSYIIQHEFK